MPTVVWKLSDKGAKVKAKNNEGTAALMIVAREGEEELVKQLLENGANPMKKMIMEKQKLILQKIKRLKKC